MNKSRGRARLVDVAEASGVTKSVVSRVLNGDPSLRIRDKTRSRILETATALSYEPHAGAKALAGSRPDALALLIPDLTNAVYARIARGAYQRARELGYVVLLAEDTEDSHAHSDYTDLVSSGRVEGLLIASSREGHPLLAAGQLDRIPHVFVNRSVPGSMRNVSIDLSGASASAYNYLYGLGHRTLGHISGPGELTPAREREAGFLGAAEAAGQPAPMVAHEAFSAEGGYRGTRRLLTEHPDITAIYAGTFQQAAGALKALHSLRLRIPGDVSVLSYDDLPIAEFLEPSLSAMALPLLELGRASVDALVEQLQGEPARDVLLDHDAAIIARSSTGPPPCAPAQTEAVTSITDSGNKGL
jgi:DNA-binding LacI/PurR family transcriptional regulator